MKKIFFASVLILVLAAIFSCESGTASGNISDSTVRKEESTDTFANEYHFKDLETIEHLL